MINTLLNFFENKTLYYALLFGLCIILFLIVLIILISCHKKKKQQDKTVMIKKVNTEKTKESNNEDFNDDEIEKMKAKLEIQKMIDQMQEDLDNKVEEAVANFEQEQEEKAIISYQELLKSANKEVDNKNLDLKKNISINDIENIEENTIKEHSIDIIEPEIEDNELDIKQDIYTCGFDDSNTKKFKSTDFISPVYGVLENNSKFPHIPRFDRNIDEKEIVMRHERKENVEKHNRYNSNNDLELSNNFKSFSREIKKNEDFLNALKDFRKNL